MASNIIGHPASHGVLAATLLVGTPLIIIGALCGKSVAVIAGLCIPGSILTLAGGFGIAVKVDYELRTKRIKAEPITPYTPPVYQTDRTERELQKSRNADTYLDGLDYSCPQRQLELHRNLRKHNPDLNIRNPTNLDKISWKSKVNFEEFNYHGNGNL